LSKLETHKFKKIAYARAASGLKSLSGEDFIKLSDFRHLPYIGEAINEKILEYKSTGKISKIQKLIEENQVKINSKSNNENEISVDTVFR
jgi:DNA polymerase/3'-5' exonuclease PolX